MSKENVGEMLKFIRAQMQPGDIKLVRRRLNIDYRFVRNVVTEFRPHYEYREKIIAAFLQLFAERAEADQRNRALMAKIQQPATD